MEKSEGGPKERKKFDHIVKVITLGEKAVGKTSLLNRYIDGRF